MPAKKAKINLLPQEEFDVSTVGRILKWALSSFRIIVIVTEVVVIIAFLSRFWLDARNSDLGDAIKQKQAVVLAQQAFEKEFRNTQKKLEIVSNLYNKDYLIGDLVKVVTSYLPPEIILSNFSFLDNSVGVTGLAINEAAISQLMVNLESSGRFSEVTLTRVNQNAEETTLEFTLSMAMKGEGDN